MLLCDRYRMNRSSVADRSESRKAAYSQEDASTCSRCLSWESHQRSALERKANTKAGILRKDKSNHYPSARKCLKETLEKLTNLQPGESTFQKTFIYDSKSSKVFAVKVVEASDAFIGDSTLRKMGEAIDFPMDFSKKSTVKSVQDLLSKLTIDSAQHKLEGKESDTRTIPFEIEYNEGEHDLKSPQACCLGAGESLAGKRAISADSLNPCEDIADDSPLNLKKAGSGSDASCQDSNPVLRNQEQMGKLPEPKSLKASDVANLYKGAVKGNVAKPTEIKQVSFVGPCGMDTLTETGVSEQLSNSIYLGTGTGFPSTRLDSPSNKLLSDESIEDLFCEVEEPRIPCLPQKRKGISAEEAKFDQEAQKLEKLRFCHVKMPLVPSRRRHLGVKLSPPNEVKTSTDPQATPTVSYATYSRAHKFLMLSQNSSHAPSDGYSCCNTVTQVPHTKPVPKLPLVKRSLSNPSPFSITSSDKLKATCSSSSLDISQDVSGSSPQKEGVLFVSPPAKRLKGIIKLVECQNECDCKDCVNLKSKVDNATQHSEDQLKLAEEAIRLLSKDLQSVRTFLRNAASAKESNADKSFKRVKLKKIFNVSLKRETKAKQLLHKLEQNSIRFCRGEVSGKRIMFADEAGGDLCEIKEFAKNSPISDCRR